MVWGMPILRATLNIFANVPEATFIPESRVDLQPCQSCQKYDF